MREGRFKSARITLFGIPVLETKNKRQAILWALLVQFGQLIPFLIIGHIVALYLTHKI